MIQVFLSFLLIAAVNASSVRILVLGDSLAAGYGLQIDEAFPALLAKQATEVGLEIEVINAGVSGDTTAGGLRRLEPLLDKPIDVMIVELGANDALRGFPAETVEANLNAIIETARKRYPELEVIIAGMQLPPILGFGFSKDFGKVFPRVAKAHDAELIPFLLDGVGGVAALNQRDRIHPTAKGQQVLADNVWRVLGPMLERRKAASE